MRLENTRQKRRSDLPRGVARIIHKFVFTQKEDVSDE